MSDKKRWVLRFTDSDGSNVDVKFNIYETEEGTTSVEMGPYWKNTLHNNENCDRPPSLHQTVYDNNNDYRYDDKNKIFESKTWFDKNGNKIKSETYIDNGNDHR